ncbi:MAG: hypothetical protein AAF596_09050 [Planctomycetota bacterium]
MADAAHGHAEENPFASPRATDQGVAPANPPDSPRNVAKHFACWAAAVAINLPVQVMFGLTMVDRAGLMGVLVGLAIVVGLAGLLLAAPAWVSETTMRGVAVFAVTQLFPFCQMIAGFIAVGICVELGLSGFDSDDIVGKLRGFLPCLIACLLTWGILLVPMVGLGFFLRMVLPRNSWRFHPRGSRTDVTVG